MTRAPRPLTRLLALVALGALPSACKWQDRPIAWSFERMIAQPSARAYEPSSFFADSMAMRRPPEGTVARTAGPTDPAIRTGRVGRETERLVPLGIGRATFIERARPPFVARIPIPLTMADLDRGQDRFRVVCAVCHGIDGSGESAVAANMQLRKPPSLLDTRIQDAPDGRIFSVISEGYGLMPSYAGHLDVMDRWRVVAYVRALELAQRAPVDALPEPVRRELLEALPEAAAPGVESAPADTAAAGAGTAAAPAPGGGTG